MEKLKENIETQQPKRDETSISIVKTPLVDALRSWFFNVPEAIEGQPAIHR